MIDTENKLKPKAFIFDIFGVICGSLNTKWGKENLGNTPELLARFNSLAKEIDSGIKHQSDYYDLASTMVHKSPEKIKNEIESSFKINAELMEVIGKLKEKYKTAICSNSDAIFVKHMFQENGLLLENYFDFICISSEIGLLKPSEEIFRYCAQKINVIPSECIFIDDVEDNVEISKSVGMIGYQFTNTKLFKDWLKEKEL